MDWIIRNEITDRTIVAWFALRDVEVRAASAELDAAFDARAGELRSLFSSPALATSIFAGARRLYSRMGIDPTRHRPSSEALVRRILQGRDLYRVNTAVDAANLASITHFRPVGLYDADRISADESSGPAGRAVRTVTLRLGREGESYPGINKDRISVFGRPTLVDREGPFGNPSSDSDRTRITMQTCRLLFVLFEPIDETGDSIRAHLDASLETLRRFTGGDPEGTGQA